MIRTILIILALFYPAPAAADNISAYVWDFATRKDEQTDLSANLTREFEEAISSLNSQFTILNGRDPNRFTSHRENVKTIQTLVGASQALVDEMKSFRVDQVIFGEVHDDVASGELVLTVTFETLEGKKVLIKSGSMKRGLQADRNARVAMVQRIVDALGSRTRNVERLSSDGFIIDLVECRRASRVITCSFTVTNDGEDREFFVYSSKKTRLFDNQNNQLNPASERSSVALANQIRNASFGTKAFLAASVPTSLAVAFDQASTSATKIVRLDLGCWESDHEKDFTVTFRNIVIKQD